MHREALQCGEEILEVSGGQGSHKVSCYTAFLLTAPHDHTTNTNIQPSPKELGPLYCHKYRALQQFTMSLAQEAVYELVGVAWQRLHSQFGNINNHSSSDYTEN